MREMIHDYGEPVRGSDGVYYHARVSGATREDGMWDGWMEFSPLDGNGPPVASRETEQASAEDLAYWATGISPVYLEGALERAQSQVKILDELTL